MNCYKYNRGRSREKKRPARASLWRSQVAARQLRGHDSFSQSQTADRVPIHVDTELGAKDLLNNRMAYVAVSRGAYDAQIFTNDREKLGTCWA